MIIVKPIMLGVVILCANMIIVPMVSKSIIIECRYVVFHSYRYAEGHYAKCRHAECRGAFNISFYEPIFILSSLWIQSKII